MPGRDFEVFRTSDRHWPIVHRPLTSSLELGPVSEYDPNRTPPCYAVPPNAISRTGDPLLRFDQYRRARSFRLLRPTPEGSTIPAQPTRSRRTRPGMTCVTCSPIVADTRAAGRSHELFLPSSARGTGKPSRCGHAGPHRCALRFSQPPDALLLPEPSGFISLRWHSWGLFPSEVFPRRSPNASRLVVPLLTLPGNAESPPGD
jgi:hypothetical protein